MTTYAVDVDRRPHAAIAARRRQRAHRLVAELAERLDEVADEHLLVLHAVVVEELRVRQLPL